MWMSVVFSEETLFVFTSRANFGFDNFRRSRIYLFETKLEHVEFGHERVVISLLPALYGGRGTGEGGGGGGGGELGVLFDPQIGEPIKPCTRLAAYGGR